METLFTFNPTHTVDLILAPALSLTAALTSDPYLNFRSGRRFKMQELVDDGDVLRPLTTCGNWDPVQIGFGGSSTLNAIDYEVNAEQCPLDFHDRVLRGDANYPVGYPVDTLTNEMETIGAMLLSRMMRRSVNRHAWFADTSIEDLIADGTYDLGNMSPGKAARLVKQQRMNEGLWTLAKYGVERDLINFVNLYEGAGSIDYTASAAIRTALDGMIANSTLNMQFDEQEAGDPVFIMSARPFKALENFYTNLGTEAAHRILVEGQPDKRRLTYKGYDVIVKPEFDQYQKDIGRAGKDAFIIFTARKNATIIGNAEAYDGNTSGAAFYVQRSPNPKLKGLTEAFGMFGMDFGWASTDLMTVAFNTSDLPALAGM
jgi:hypothetical protein